MKTNGINLCKTCHETIHTFWSEKELGNYYNTLARLMENKKFREYVVWIKKQK